MVLQTRQIGVPTLPAYQPLMDPGRPPDSQVIASWRCVDIAVHERRTPPGGVPILVVQLVYLGVLPWVSCAASAPVLVVRRILVRRADR
jgi:hypothetical protein